MKKILHIAIFAFLHLISRAQDTGTLFGGGGAYFAVGGWLKNVPLSPAGQFLLNKQPSLQFDGIWTAAGPKIAGNGQGGTAITAGGFTVGGKLSGELAGFTGEIGAGYTFNYQVDLVPINENMYLVQLSWTKTSSGNGSNGAGVSIMGVIKRGTPGLLPKETAIGAPPGGVKTAPPAIKPGPALGSITMSIDIPYEWGYQGADGVYYVVAGRITGSVMTASAAGYDFLSDTGDGSSSSGDDSGGDWDGVDSSGYSAAADWAASVAREIGDQNLS